MAKLSFSAQIADWVNRVEGATEAVFKESAQEIVSEMQKPRAAGGQMRIDTGFLRASLMASTASMPSIQSNAAPVEGQSYAFNDGAIEAVIAGSELGDTIYFGYTAAYAGYREYGANGQAPDAFVRTAVQRWPGVVADKTNEIRRRLGL